MKNNLTAIKLILESLEKEVLKEEGFDSQEDKQSFEYSKQFPSASFSPKENFTADVEALCKKYLAKGLKHKDMLGVLSSVGTYSDSFYN